MVKAWIIDHRPMKRSNAESRDGIRSGGSERFVCDKPAAAVAAAAVNEATEKKKKKNVERRPAEKSSEQRVRPFAGVRFSFYKASGRWCDT